MSTLSLRLPDSLHDVARELAQKEHISINQLITNALSEKMSALMTEDYLAQRAKRASKSKFRKALKQIPDIEPNSVDKLP